MSDKEDYQDADPEYFETEHRLPPELRDDEEEDDDGE